LEQIKRIQTLVKELNQHSYEYYTLSKPSISDKEYDAKYKELEKLEWENNYLLPDSPTQRIGDIVLDKFEKHEHKFKCYSMDKAQSFEELEEWDKKNRLFVKQNNLPNIQYVVAKKFDGLTINNTYDNEGLFVTSATRGTGEKGELITSQVKTIKSIPLRIDNNSLIEIHGEAFMTKKEFNMYNQIAEITLKNLRNGAAGAIKNLDVKETAKRNLSAFFYDVGYSEGIKFSTYMDMMDFIQKMGLPVDREYYLCNTIEEAKEKIDLIESLRPDLEYEIDGAIVSINDIKTREMMGYTVKFPRWAIAYKYEAEETTTKLLDVDFNTGRTGKVTPRGMVEPVELMSATVSFATLNSMDDIRRKGVKIGSEVFIRRSNDVIPEILGVVEDSLTDDMKEIQMPTHCKSCGSELIQEGVHYFCKNSLYCKPQIVKSIAHFGSLEAMNIDGFSEKTAQLLYENDIVNSVLDLFNLESKREQIIKLPKFGIKKYDNLIQSIENCKKVKPNQFLYALGIDEIGRKASKDICNFFNNDIQKVIDAKPMELYKIDGIGEATVDSFVKYFSDGEKYNMVLNLIRLMEFEINKLKSITATDSPFTGKKLYCTGSFQSYKKDELKAIVEGLGAEFTSGYAKSLDYLVVGSLKGSSKEDKAKKDGVKILTEDEFLIMIGRKG
jgi:DNA ligase (NAD+)